MHELVKSALAAEKSGDRQRAHGYLKQALTENPKDVDAWLVLAATFEDPEKKRQCLNKVIAIDPVNRIARDELLVMDRALLAGKSSQPPEPTPQTRIEPALSPPAPVRQLNKFFRSFWLLVGYGWYSTTGEINQTIIYGWD